MLRQLADYALPPLTLGVVLILAACGALGTAEDTAGEALDRASREAVRVSVHTLCDPERAETERLWSERLSAEGQAARREICADLGE